MYEHDYLCHYGILGMKWGVRRFQNPDGSLTPEGRERYGSGISASDLKQTHHSNLEKWGSEDNNILFITGYSGSGKSTLSDKIASKTGANVIHLDVFTDRMYFYGHDRKDVLLDGQDEEFTKYLNKHMPNFTDLSNPKTGDKQYGKMLDKFESCMEGFAKEQQKQGKKVIVEGLQLLDDTFYPDKSSLKGRPIMVMKTSALKSFYRAGVRDEKLNASDLTPADLAEYIRWYSEGNSQIKHLLKCAVI